MASGGGVPYPICLMLARIDRNVAGRILLLTAFACLIAFHLLPVDDTPSADGTVERGWAVWPAISELCRNFNWLVHVSTLEPLFMMGLVALIGWLLIGVTSPFVVKSLIRSRTLWGISTLTSGYCLVICLIIFGRTMGDSYPGLPGIPPAILSMLASVLLNFLGLAVLARARPENSSLPG
jgi:hypothetical protein